MMALSRVRTFRALRHRNFRLFFVGQGLSNMGTWLQQVAMGWLTYRLSGSAWLLGVVAFCANAGILAFGTWAGVFADRSQFFKDLSGPFYGANRPDARVSLGLRDAFWRQGMQAGLKGAYDCIKVFSETDLTEDLKKFDVPTLIVHGDDDQIVPIADSALLSSKIVKNSVLKIYKGAPHGLPSTLKDQLNADLLAFIRA